MEITFVGTGDAFGSGGRFQTCIRVEAEGHTVLVDCGATTLTAFKAQGMDPQQVDAVAISHLHADHFGGLPFLILDGQFTRRTKPLTILGPHGTEARLLALMEACYPLSTSVRRRFDVEVIELTGDGRSEEAGPVTLRSWEVDHASGAPALALNATIGDRTFGYSGDTSWTAALTPASAETDLFACEAYTYDSPVPFHLAYSTILENHNLLPAAELILTHMGPTVLSRLDTLEFAAACDGLRRSI